MATQLISSSSSSAATSIYVPPSASFIGSSEDALVLQSLVLNSTTDRLREYIIRNLGAAGESISKIEKLSVTLEKLGKFIQSDWVPATYSGLKEFDHNAASLRILFSRDGPNLGDSLDKSQEVLAELTAEGVTLDAPKKTPVMTEQFAAVGGKLDFSKAPSATSLEWRSDQDISTIDSGATPGTYPGSVVKTIESRDSSGKLISATRITIFVDYANLRPQEADLDKEFLAYAEKIKLTIDDLILRLADIFKNESALSQRLSQESLQIKDDQKKFFEKEQENSANAVEFRRLFRMFYLEINSLKKIFSDGKSMSDTGLIEPVSQRSTGILSSEGTKNSFLLGGEGDTDPSNPMDNFFANSATFYDFKYEISSLKSLLISLNKSADRFTGSGSEPA
jgi:hypothetical protein